MKPTLRIIIITMAIILSSNPTNLGLAVSYSSIRLSHQVVIPFVVAAEYIAKGYKLSDAILQRAIDMDSSSL
jgi:hypothetical protein